MDSTRVATRSAAGAAVGGLLFGADTSTMNGAINGVRPDFGLESSLVGFVVAVSILGCAAGALTAGRIAARFGSTGTMRLGGVVIAVGSLLAALSFAVLPLAACRLVVGFGVGLLSVVVPGYITEISPERIRGRLGSLWQLAIVLGIFGGLLADYALRTAAGSADSDVPWGGHAWRWMFVVIAVAAVVQVLVALRLPEPTRAGEHEPAGGFAALRGSLLGLKPIVWVGIVVAALQQFVGINVIFFYSTTLWKSVGFSEDDAFVTSLLTALVNIAATVVAIGLVDRLGRRPLMIGGAAGMAVTLGTLAVCFASATGTGDDVTLPQPAGTVALVAANLFVVAFGVSWGPLMWVVLGELFDTRIRTVALSLTVMVNWLANWLVTRTFPTLADVSLPLTYGLYTGFAAVALVFTARKVPETKGVTLA
ncbi:MFS transporter [Rhodococcus gannanensis]|uniref:MFS transporter n=1 Tax=Rhodococcus gannanensis TaxID=1960308 RepID=A0ABW4NXJ7_9NOCA